MNEIKRQLNEKMGNTKVRSEKIIQLVEQKKRKQQKKSPTLYYVTFATFAALLAVLLYINPFEIKAPITSTPLPTPVKQPEQTALNLKNFFKQDGDIAYFVGMNNEYATFTETTNWLSENYVKISVDNGGIETRKIYRITDDAIYLVFEDKPEMHGNVEITLEHLDTLTPISILLVADIENTKTIDENAVTYQIELNTPLQKFENVIQITKETEYTTTAFYYAENFGLIGQISTFQDGAQIISLLTSINTEPSFDLSLPVINQDTNQKETLTFEQRIMIDPLLIYHPKFTETTATYKNIYEYEAHEFGFLEINLPEHSSSHIVVRTGHSLKTIAADFTKIVDWRFSPDQKYVAIYFSNGHDWQSEQDYRPDRIRVFHLEELLVEKLLTDDELTLYSYPILSYKWLDNTTLEYVTPDIDEPSNSKLFIEWMQAKDQPTKIFHAQFE